MNIDWKKVDKMLAEGCDGVQISARLGVHRNTLYEHCKREKGCAFSEYAAEKRSVGDSFLHAKQFQLAMEGNSSMLIWLGKNRLRQADQQQVDHNIQINMIDYSKAEIDPEEEWGSCKVDGPKNYCSE